jgi:hypothetical protein
MSRSKVFPNLSLRIATSTGCVDEFVRRLSLHFRLAEARGTRFGTIQQLIVRFRMPYVGNCPKTTIRSSGHTKCSGNMVRNPANAQGRFVLNAP